MRRSPSANGPLRTHRELITGLLCGEVVGAPMGTLGRRGAMKRDDGYGRPGPEEGDSRSSERVWERCENAYDVVPVRGDLRMGLSGVLCRGRLRSSDTEPLAEEDGELGFASVNSRGGRFYSSAVVFRTKDSSFIATSSLRKWPRVRTARRRFAFIASMDSWRR